MPFRQNTLVIKIIKSRMKVKKIALTVLLFILCFAILGLTQSNSLIDWTKPIAYCRQKFIGCTILHDYLSPNWARYWNQATPQYLGKWTSTESNRNQMSWSGLDFAWNYTRQNNLLFKGHTFVWGQQIPGWVGGLSPADQKVEVEEWIKLYCQRYADYHLIDVVNEPLHETPNYVNAIGGTGTTGWDWVVWSYQTARKYCPNAKLLINDYYILTDAANTQKYIEIINILKSKNLIDGIGCQAHHLQATSNSIITTNLNTLQTTGLPIYISQLDLDFSDDTQQLNRFKQLIPLLYEHPAVKGITFWGYTKGEQWQSGSWMYDPNASVSASTIGLPQQRASLKWLKYQYLPAIKSPITPTASFKYSLNGTVVSFDGSLSTDCNETISTYSWLFGDGTSGAGKVVSHTYKTSGVYNVQLKIQDNNGKNDSLTQKISIGTSNQSPVSQFTSIASNLTVKVDGSASKSANGSISSYLWTWGDSTANSTGTASSHTYSVAGTYTITLTVTDNSGLNATSTKSITVNSTPMTNISPISKFKTNISNLTVTFVSTSTDADGSIVSYAWNLGNGVTNINKQFTYSYPNAGTYTVTLTVTDNLDASSYSSQSITVTQQSQPSAKSNNSPVSAFGYWISGMTLNFWFSGYDTDGQIISYQWNFGNGQTSNAKQPSYTYSKAGTYVITLTVTDNLGSIGVSSQKVQISNPIAISLHLQSLAKSVVKIGSLYYGKADVKVFDNLGSPIANVSVSGQISNPSLNFWQNISGVTDSSGQVSLVTAKGVSSLPSIDTCIWNFNHSSLWYNANDNKSSNCI